MLTDLTLILLALFILAFIGLLWLRHGLLQHLTHLRRQQELLLTDYARRRDQVPLLLESIRETQAPNDAWQNLVQKRAQTQLSPSLQAEQEFETVLATFLQNTPLRSLSFLEAKKSIEDTGTLIQKQKETIQTALTTFNTQCKTWPYTLAAGIFGLTPKSL